MDQQHDSDDHEVMDAGTEKKISMQACNILNELRKTVGLTTLIQFTCYRPLLMYSFQDHCQFIVSKITVKFDTVTLQATQAMWTSHLTFIILQTEGHIWYPSPEMTDVCLRITLRSLEICLIFGIYCICMIWL